MRRFPRAFPRSWSGPSSRLGRNARFRVNPWDRLTDAGPAATALLGATIALLALPILQWLVPRGRRHRGAFVRLVLGLAVLLAASAIVLGTMGAASPGNVLQLVAVLALMIG